MAVKERKQVFVHVHLSGILGASPEKMSRNRSLTVWVVDSCRWLYIGLHVVF